MRVVGTALFGMPRSRRHSATVSHAAVAGEDAARSAARAARLATAPRSKPAGTRDRDAPGQAGPPAGVAEIIADRGERVEHGCARCRPPVAVAVDREADDRRRAGIADGRSRRPSCRSARCARSRARSSAGGDELVGEQLPAAAFIGEAGERVEQIEIAHDRAVAGLLAPDRDHDRWRARRSGG